MVDFSYLGARQLGLECLQERSYCMVKRFMHHISRSHSQLLMLRILLLALVYVAAGRLSLLLAIPPGFVSGLFLPMGIALGALLIWGLPMSFGVFIGSTVLNIS